jgi:hypothetical protein
VKPHEIKLLYAKHRGIAKIDSSLHIWRALLVHLIAGLEAHCEWKMNNCPAQNAD